MTMRQDLTDISVILDRSGSMQSVRADTIGGYNAFIAAQAKLPGEARCSLYQFDDRYETVYSATRAQEVKPLNDATFVPRGSTALLDAIGRTINESGARLSATPEDQRPAKVIVVIITDGHENASKEFTKAKVAEMIERQRKDYSWEFVFIGANQDAIKAGAEISIPAKSSISYTADSHGTQAVFTAASNYAGSMRCFGSASFSDEERNKAVGGSK